MQEIAKNLKWRVDVQDDVRLQTCLEPCSFLLLHVLESLEDALKGRDDCTNRGVILRRSCFFVVLEMALEPVEEFLQRCEVLLSEGDQGTFH